MHQDLTRVREEENMRTGKKEYVLTERGERLLTILEKVWGGETLHNVSETYERKKRVDEARG
jgi:DNA-binding HxlR family transcriptional regulator